MATTKADMSEEVLEYLRNPFQVLRTALLADPDNSLEMARKTGVPGATIRSLRNGQSAAVNAETWGKLMMHLRGDYWRSLKP